MKDGTTGTISWRSGRKGMKRDLDGDAIVGKKDRKAKRSSSHAVHRGRRSKKDIHHPNESSWKE